MQRVKAGKILFKNDNTVSGFMEWVVAAVLLQSILGNMLSFYLTLGNQFSVVRWGINWGTNGILFLLVASCFILSRGSVKSRILAMLWPLLVMGIYIAAIFVHPTQIFEIAKGFLVFVVQGGTLAMAAWLLYTRVAALGGVIRKAIAIGLIVQPFYIGAIITFLLRTSTDTDNFGTISYLEIAYSALTILAIVLYYYGWGNGQYERHTKSIRVFSIIESVISSVVLVVSGSRGALLGVAFLLVSVAVMVLLFKADKRIFVPLILVVLCVFGTYAALPKTSVSKARVENEYTRYETDMTPEQENEAREKTIVKKEENAENEATDVVFLLKGRELVLKKIPNGPTKKLCQKIGLNEGLLSIFYENAWSGGGMSEIAYDMRDEIEQGASYGMELNQAVYSVTNGSSARWYFWALAAYELENHHGAGIAPLGYHLKYDSYAHNIWIEAYAEFGVIGGTVFLLITLLVLACAIREAGKNKENTYFLIFLAMIFTQLFLSGDLYGDRWFCFLIATGAVSIYTWKKNLGKKEEVSL